jgi:hypothetical protein
MNIIQAVNAIKLKFNKIGHSVEIPKLRRGSFMAEMTADGIKVSNLGTQPHLPWAVFQEAICVLIRNGGHAMRGDAIGGKLGDAKIPLDSIEGHIAQVVYGKKRGDAVFRRIVPIACILIWADICDAGPRELILRDFRH